MSSENSAPDVSLHLVPIKESLKQYYIFWFCICLCVLYFFRRFVKRSRGLQQQDVPLTDSGKSANEQTSANEDDPLISTGAKSAQSQDKVIQVTPEFKKFQRNFLLVFLIVLGVCLCVYVCMRDCLFGWIVCVCVQRKLLLLLI